MAAISHIPSKFFVLFSFIAFWTLCQCSCNPEASTAPTPRPIGAGNEDDIELMALQAGDLIGGVPQDLRDYPAVVYSLQRDGRSASRCTATLIGERTLLLAAHCVGDGKTAVFSVAGVRYESKCKRAPGYPANATADWALCLVTKPVMGVPYEVLSQDLLDVKVGDEILLTGFGCVNPREPDGSGGDGGNDGVYRVGKAKVAQVPSEKSNDIVTNEGAALCFGDSGGPSFVVATNGTRKMLSVNSRGDIAKTSYLVSVATPEAKAFMQSWAKSTKQMICGMHAEASGCRSAPYQP